MWNRLSGSGFRFLFAICQYTCYRRYGAGPGLGSSASVASGSAFASWKIVPIVLVSGSISVPAPSQHFLGVTSTVSFLVEYDVRKQCSNTLDMA